MNRISSAFVAALLFAGSAQAQWGQRPGEHAQNRQELLQDRREQRDDVKDLAELKDVLASFDKARARKSEHQLMAVESRLKKLLREELAENRAELEDSKADARRADSRREAQAERRNVMENAASLGARERISRELSSLLGSRRPADLNRQRKLIVELIDLAEKEIRQNKQEQRDDRNPRRDDHRRG